MALITCLFILIFVSLALSASDLYPKYCNDFVPAPKTLETENQPVLSEFHLIRSLNLAHATFIGGTPLFNASQTSRSVSFRVIRVMETEVGDVFKIAGRIRLRESGSSFSRVFRSPRTPFPRVRGPRMPSGRGIVSIAGEGFWSNSSKRICLIASGNGFLSNGTLKDFMFVVKLQYPRIGSLLNSFVNGSVNIIEEDFDFQRISISGLYSGDYEYRNREDAENVCGSTEDDLEFGLKNVSSACGLQWIYSSLDLVWNSDCRGRDCSPFNISNKDWLPKTMYILSLKCDSQGQVRGLFGLTNSTDFHPRFGLPSQALIGEGLWDAEKGRLCMTVCILRIPGLSDAFPEDCSIRLSYQFLSSWTIQTRYPILGHIQSDKSLNDSLYFKRFAFQGPNYHFSNLPASNIIYRYTMLDKVKQVCSNTTSTYSQLNSSGKYPDGSSYTDLSFNIYVELSDGKRMHGLSEVLAIGEKIRSRFFSRSAGSSSNTGTNPGQHQFNVSYTLNFGPSLGILMGRSDVRTEGSWSIFAEGLYDPRTGLLCMVGCKQMDCQIQIVVQFAPLGSNMVYHASGLIRSLRSKNDPDYFEPLKLSSRSVYSIEVKRAIWREDLELIMALVSPTLAALFICSQLFYIRKHSNILPTISMLMITLLTLGYMIPLVLNFEALFRNQKGKNVLKLGGGWFEINEVLVRLITMITFLLQVRVLQLVWNSRLAAAGQKSAWSWERSVLCFCLPLYFAGAVIACLIHWLRLSHKAKHTVWEDFRSYGGVVLDGFLLPQVLGNIIWDISGTVLVPSFYVGMTAVRAMPHVYDAYRAIKFKPQISSFYYYADPEWDFYSTAWDIVIPFAGFLFALIIFLQQKFGPRCIVPDRFSHQFVYQKIAVSEGSEMHVLQNH